jgi:hypothetical protein
MDTDLQRVLQLHWQEKYNINRVGALPSPVHFRLCLYVSAHVLCSQQLMILLRDKSIKLAHLYFRGDWLERYNASVGLRLNEATTQASKMEVRAHDLELELARANSERNVRRAAAEQKAK